MNQEDWTRLDQLMGRSRSIFIASIVVIFIVIFLLFFLLLNFDWFFNKIFLHSFTEYQILRDKYAKLPFQTGFEKDLANQNLRLLGLFLEASVISFFNSFKLCLLTLLPFVLVLGRYSFRVYRTLQSLKIKNENH